MAIWQRSLSLQQLNQQSQGTLVSHLGIVFVAINGESLQATMPVDSRTRQPFGLLHGGASVVLAETLGSMAGYLCTAGDDYIAGLEVSASHMRAVREGLVWGECRALHLGRTHQVWHTDIFDAQRRLCCSVRLTTAIMTAR
ncbi:hotdog fold thioesterase [Erwinia psidii]|uniref:Hotdog fold thioesterase n=1 Tax=Erwinia psidii TaxID=69224 RepID=A0A3N6SMZ7_9GAMM|nr:hotdog fold thioesterase [Erwinia psidii]MCX8956123.1 hotdog fold thioesterase [Erwinia psidii]MCX8960112.1 hotdog fold thioesterase [Erwinia psidii]MCX8963658.1 hotdog fold thioesterase [Erwinia psidii]RQM39096.1 hotdog fold thioesterase [Erwinia psidii]